MLNIWPGDRHTAGFQPWVCVLLRYERPMEGAFSRGFSVGIWTQAIVSSKERLYHQSVVPGDEYDA